MAYTHHDKIKIIIADDHPLVREGLMQIISQGPDMTVVEQAEDGFELLDKIRSMDLDIVLMDLDMPEKNGWDVMRQLKVEFPNLPIIILSVSSEDEYAVECFRSPLGPPQVPEIKGGILLFPSPGGIDPATDCRIHHGG